jgi:hypothetical protein
MSEGNIPNPNNIGYIDYQYFWKVIYDLKNVIGQLTGGGVASVTGLNTDNTDPNNPVVKISVDGVTVTGLGTPGSPLTAPGGSGAPVYPAEEVPFGDGITPGGTTSNLFSYSLPGGVFAAIDSSFNGIASDPVIKRFQLGFLTASPCGILIEQAASIFRTEGGLTIATGAGDLTLTPFGNYILSKFAGSGTGTLTYDNTGTLVQLATYDVLLSQTGTNCSRSGLVTYPNIDVGCIWPHIIATHR